MYLLDTNVISELRRIRPNPVVRAWISGIPADQLFLSAVTLAELQAGVEITREQDAAKAEEIEAWTDAVAETHKVLAADATVFRLWAKLVHHKSADLFEDALIAATALIHDLTVATRNLRDFDQFGVRTLNPFHRGSR